MTTDERIDALLNAIEKLSRIQDKPLYTEENPLPGLSGSWRYQLFNVSVPSGNTGVLLFGGDAERWFISMWGDFSGVTVYPQLKKPAGFLGTFLPASLAPITFNYRDYGPVVSATWLADNPGVQPTNVSGILVSWSPRA